MGAKASRAAPPQPSGGRLGGVNSSVVQPPKKILLLGASDSGKSTIMKQLQIIYKGDLGDQSSWKELVCQNAYATMKHLILYMREEGFSWSEYRDNYNLAESILALNAYTESMPAFYAEGIHRMWNDPITRQLVEQRRSEVLLSDCSEYFLNNIIRIGCLDYQATNQDILMAWSVSTGISTSHLSMNSISVSVFETSGSRSERRKWINCFESASVVVFCGSLSEYNLGLREASDVNRLSESLTVFEAITNSRWFERTALVLFLTKADIFAQKIIQIPLSDYYPDYTGGPSFENGVQYIKTRYLVLQQKPRTKIIHTFVLNATDTVQVADALAYIHVSILAINITKTDLI